MTTTKRRTAPRHMLPQQRYTPSADGAGGTSGTWSTLRQIRLEVVPVAGLEQFREQQLQARPTHRLKGRWCSDVHRGDRFQLAARFLFVQEVINVQELGQDMVLLTQEREAA